jgi:RNA polymerase sigma-70 factor (ECF subfamily)
MDMTNLSDIEYIHRVRQGDTNAFVYLVQRYQRMIFSLVVKTVGNSSEAEDITQEIFIKVYQSLPKFREDSKFSTWLYRVACNFCFSHLRKQRDNFVSLNEEIISAGEFSDFEEQLENAAKEERIQWLDALLKELPAEELWIVTLYYKENLPVHEISEITNLSESNVKVKLHRTRKWIRCEIEKRMKQ